MCGTMREAPVHDLLVFLVGYLCGASSSIAIVRRHAASQHRGR
jgi:hypothetical protein